MKVKGHLQVRFWVSTYLQHIFIIWFQIFYIEFKLDLIEIQFEFNSIIYFCLLCFEHSM